MKLVQKVFCTSFLMGIPIVLPVFFPFVIIEQDFEARFKCINVYC